MSPQNNPRGKHAQQANTATGDEKLPSADVVADELQAGERTAAGADDVTELIAPVSDDAAGTQSAAGDDVAEGSPAAAGDITELIAPVPDDATEAQSPAGDDAAEAQLPAGDEGVKALSDAQDDATEALSAAADDATAVLAPVKVGAHAYDAAGEPKKKGAKSPKHAQGKKSAQKAGDEALTQRIDTRRGTGAGSNGAKARSASGLDTAEALEAAREQDAAKAMDALGFVDAPDSPGTSGAQDVTDVLDVPEIVAAPNASGMPGAPAGYVAAGFGEMPSKKRRRGLKVFGITLGVIIAILLVAYLVGAVVFMGRFLPNTSIGAKDVSLKTDAEVAKILEDTMSSYQVDVVGGGFSCRLSSADIGLSVNTDRILKSMHADMDAWRWPLLIVQPSHDETDKLEVSYKKDSYEPKLTAEVDKFNETAKDPVNATIAYDEKTETFTVQPEVPGTKLSKDAVLKSTAEAISELETKVNISDEHLIPPAVLSTDQKLIDAAQLATGMVSAHLDLYMGGKVVAQVDGAALSPFVSVNDQFEVTFSDEEINNWVDAMADSFNTVGTERVYTRPDGKEIAVSGGAYGWEVDRDLFKEAVLEGIRAGKPAEVGVPCLDTAQVYNGPNQPDWGARYIDVDLSEQYVRFYGDDGGIIWEAPCISGAPDGKHDTGLGVWCVNAKESPSKLIGYEDGKKIYETSVKYWMPFEGNGIGFHDATWQPSFGGSMYANGYGSHGCVNLSYSAAESLYGIVEPGDVVIVHW